MGTRAAAFTAKIRSLQEYCSRLQHGVFPQPSGVDVANTLKYFSGTLLGVLKDVPSISLEVMCSPSKDHARISLFPNLDYTGLHFILVQLLETLPQVQSGVQTLGQTLLHTICCLIPFLEHELMDQLPYVVASSMAVLPTALHKDLLDMLCFNLLPFTIQRPKADDDNAGVEGDPAKKNKESDESDLDNLSYANLSVSSIIMMVLLYTDVPAYYTQLIETLMKIKVDISADLFCVIAHGTVKARCPAVELLFQYWPQLNPSSVDRKVLTEKHSSWQPLQCQHENCPSSALSNEAVKMCVDHTLAIGSGDRPPPMLICLDCADVVYRGKVRDTLMDILLPLEDISYTCENKTCKSPLAQKVAVTTCFSTECTNYNCNKPVRYCSNCHEAKHVSGEARFLTKHIVQMSIPSPWDMDPETQSYFVEAIISLLKEAQPNEGGKGGKDGGVAGSSQEKNRAMGTLPTDESLETMALEERQLLSRYGVWMITSLCTPDDKTPDDVLGRLLAMLFQWFHCTACLPDDQAGSALERLKGECIHGWLMKVVKSHFEVLANCLLPHPVDYAKVGGHWDCWPSQTNQIKEGFKRLLCLVPYDIITLDVWSHIMPFWMECFRHEVPEEELAELKILLSKVLDPDLSPLGFTSKQMYQFIAGRLDNTSPPVQEQALYWIQILTMLEVPVPIKILLPMLESAMASLAVMDRAVKPYTLMAKVKTHLSSMNSPETATTTTVTPGPHPQLLSIKSRRCDSDARPSQESPPPSDEELGINCYILMLDILVKQMELQEVKSHKGLDAKEAQPVLILLCDILRAPWVGQHTCGELRLDLAPESGNVQCLFCELVAIWYQLSLSLIEFFSPLVEITMGDLQADPIIPPPKRQLPTPKTDAPVEVSKLEAGQPATEPVAVGDEPTSTLDTVVPADAAPDGQEPPSEPVDPTEGGKYFVTNQGKYRFTLEELPIELQLFYVLLTELERFKDADILYHILGTLKLMCLHAEVLNKAASTQRGFLVWCQERLLLKNLWDLLQGEFSQISQLCVPLLLHCITLPTGRDMFWQLVENNFHDEDWRARFTAVERVTTIAHFVEASAVKNSPSLQSSLANAFCYLVHCLDDIESTVAQRALLSLETIKTSSLKLLVWCLETQFDLVMIDRPMILQAVFQLYNHLSDRRFLTWDFFLNRFDALFLESQVALEALGELSQTRDLRNTNVNSEAFRKKVTRAQEALSHAHVSRSLSASFGGKLPYKRTLSAPLPQNLNRGHPPRQQSAPQARRKSSKLTGPMTSGAMFIPEKLQSHFPAGAMSDMALKEEEAHLMQVMHGFDAPEDQDSMHLLITLLMQFLSRPDHSHPTEEKVLQRNQQLVLRHLNILLGYSPSEKKFSISPNTLRGLPVFNAFITSMPKVLDFNLKMGNILLTTFLPLLVYCPSPQRFFQDMASASSPHHAPLYSLWYLQQHVRQSWLMAVLIILYKYTYDSQPISKQIHLLITIVMNTLEAQFHRCKPKQHVLSPVPTRSRDMSAASVELPELNEQQEGLYELGEDSNGRGLSASQPGSESDEDEAVAYDEDQADQLAAIPESPKMEPRDGRDGRTFDRISEEEKASTSDKNSPEMAKKSGGDKSTSSDADQLPSGEEKSFSEGSKSLPVKAIILETPPPSAAAPLSTKGPDVHQPLVRSQSPSPSRSPRPSLQRMQAVEGSILGKAKDPTTLTYVADIAEQPRVEQARVRQGMSKVMRTKSQPDQSAAVQPVTWSMGDDLGPLKLLPEKPAPERLLPIGPPTPPRPFKTQKSFHGESSAHHVHPPRPGDLPMPAHERLLPIGPPPRDRSKSPGPLGGPKRLMSPPRQECRSPFDDFLGKPFLSTSVPSSMETSERKKSSSDAVVIAMPDEGHGDQDVKKDASQTHMANANPWTATPAPPAEEAKSADDKETTEKLKNVEENVSKAEDKLFKVEEPKDIKEPDAKSEGTKSEPKSPKKNKKKGKKTDQKLSKSTPSSPKMGQMKRDSRPPPLDRHRMSTQSTMDSIGQSMSLDFGDEDYGGGKTPPADPKSGLPRYRQRRHRKTGLSTIEAQRSLESNRSSAAATGACAASVQKRARKTDSNSTAGTSGSGASGQATAGTSKRSSASQASIAGVLMAEENNIHERCMTCANVIELFSEEELGMCIVILGTYVHREPGMAAPIMPDLLRLVAKFAISYSPYPWTGESNIHLPGNVACISRQFMRCVSRQLVSNGLFQRIFASHFVDGEFFKALATSLGDFGSISQVSPLVSIFEDLNEKKNLPPLPDVLHVMSNVADYMDTLSTDVSAACAAHWPNFLTNFDLFLKTLALLLATEATPVDLSSVLRIILCTLKLPLINSHKVVLDAYSKMLSIALQQAPLPYERLAELCHHCSRSFAKERDRFILSRTATFELFQAIKLKSVIPDENVTALIQLVLQDAGGTLVPSVISETIKPNCDPEIEAMSTSAAECMKQYIPDCMEFISDVHTISRVKSSFMGTTLRLNEETLGGHLKAGLSQWIALDITRSNSRDHRAVSKYLPWLYTLTSVQQGPKEFLDCVAHIRVLSWLLLGALQHSALLSSAVHSSQYSLCQPIPLEANGHIAEHIQVILAGFAEQSKASVLHMSSLFHAFILCQLWTMYCENISGQNPPGGEQYTHITLIMYDFWVKITPGILQLVCHSKVLAEMVSLHFLSLMEALMECNSNVLARLLPMWIPVFSSYQGQLSGHLRVRLQACVNWQPAAQIKETQGANGLNSTSPMLRWLQKLQFKMAQIETQSSQATQFYTM